ncbi:hypothetical protein [Paenibacillus illinoisensis]|uniref:hypothetical protein n=1 Tax=Paenibacillus illinoisensis TaxID=59845 RepID=UPI001C8E6B1A|nr:hypothetical protein [Paenibacillus illinoisensis]
MSMIVFALFQPNSNLSTLALVILSIAIAIRNWKNQRYAAMIFLLLAVMGFTVFIKIIF